MEHVALTVAERNCQGVSCVVRVRKLGWQPGLGGGGVMLYNMIDGGSTVTLGSLVKQGCRIEVVK